ncbi:22422_t:CDS:2, partial [Gigaspora margarita]
ATEENCEAYSNCVDALLRKKEIHNLKENAQSNEAMINKEWGIISSTILKAAMKHIPDEISLCDQSKFNTQIDSLNQ